MTIFRVHRLTKITGRAALFAVLFSFFIGSAVSAQSISLQWNRWDADITVTDARSPLTITETQEIQVLNGTVRGGSRFWTTAAQIQSVSLVSTDGSVREFINGSGSTAGQYAVTQENGRTTLNYTLPTAQQRGNVFTIRINYRANSPTTSVVDWKIVPAEHDFVVQSSTARVRFPAGQGPDASLARASQGDAQLQIQGNDYILQSRQPIQPNQPFTIQIPFGVGVGAAGGNTGINNNGGVVAPEQQPIAPVNSDPGLSFGTPGVGVICGLACIVGVILLLGGSGLIRTLLGTFLGGGQAGQAGRGVIGGLFGGGRSGGGGLFGGGRNNTPGGSGLFGGGSGGSNPPGGNSGFRPSDNQDRSIGGSVGDDKDSGGGASFK